MKAQIVSLNIDTGFFAAKIQGFPDLIIFELTHKAKINIGDIISHPDFRNLGKQTFFNITRSCNIPVYAQDVCTESFFIKNYK